MVLYWYARVSSNDQDFTLQEQALRAEKTTGTSRTGRTELQVLLDFLRSGDTLVITRIDRLALSGGYQRRPAWLRAILCFD